MAILGYNLKKIGMEKLVDVLPQGEIQVRLTPQIREVRLGELRMPTGKTNAVEVLFSFVVEYNPEIAKATLEGSLLYLPPEKGKIDEILNAWENEKKLDGSMVVEVINFLNREFSPLLMVMAKEMRIPYHIPLPRAELR
ncbi:hypothetical protein [Thermococcus stetteri]|uniref:hypothetical protein n=1 Tax=Thermococcus stetteri TaxID=49900 RepID=UPI001AE90265|nr:hypothetical protein [Thermococcus stetteri]MBP1910751.1 hypothetical protein [Thermococcus stetteri]